MSMKCCRPCAPQRLQPSQSGACHFAPGGLQPQPLRAQVLLWPQPHGPLCWRDAERRLWFLVFETFAVTTKCSPRRSLSHEHGYLTQHITRTSWPRLGWLSRRCSSQTWCLQWGNHWKWSQENDILKCIYIYIYIWYWYCIKYLIYNSQRSFLRFGGVLGMFPWGCVILTSHTIGLRCMSLKVFFFWTSGEICTDRFTCVSESTSLDASRGMHSAVHHLRRKVCYAEQQDFRGSS